MEAQERQAWLEARRKGIGGSDAAVVCGLSPWKTRYQLYLEKRGEANGDNVDNPAMFWGRTLEPVIRQRYADVTGYEVEVPGTILTHPDHPWMLANVDGLPPGRVLEVKTARMADGWGEPGTDEIPDPYRLQVQHYMSVTGRDVADVAVLIGGSDFRIYEVPSDPELQEMLIEREEVFWGRVQDGNPPDPVTFQDVLARFGATSKVGVSVQADIEVVGAALRLKSLKDIIKDAKTEEEDLKAQIMRHMGIADTLMDGEKIICTWKLYKPGERFDAKEFEAAHPDLYQEFLRPNKPTRRFLLK